MQQEVYQNKLEYVRSGRPFNIKTTGEDFVENLITKIGPSRHFTFVFNFFVVLQIFNFLNARKLKDEFNIFAGKFTKY